MTNDEISTKGYKRFENVLKPMRFERPMQRYSEDLEYRKVISEDLDKIKRLMGLHIYFIMVPYEFKSGIKGPRTKIIEDASKSEIDDFIESKFQSGYLFEVGGPYFKNAKHLAKKLATMFIEERRGFTISSNGHQPMNCGGE